MPTKPTTFLSVMKSSFDGPPAPTNKMDQERIERLGIYADPYGITINATTTEYIVHLKSKIQNSGVGISRKIISRREVDSLPDPEAFMADMIHGMKKELGWNGTPVSYAYVDGEMRRREQLLKEDAEKATMATELAANSAAVIGVDPARPVKKNVPQCPEHGNALEPREVGVLGCPIEGCTVEMRKKATVGDAFKRSGDTVPPPAKLVSEATTGGFIQPPPRAVFYEDGVIQKFPDESITDLPIELVRVPSRYGWALKQGDSVIFLNRYRGEKINIARDRHGITDATVEISVRPTGPGFDIVTW